MLGRRPQLQGPQQHAGHEDWRRGDLLSLERQAAWSGGSRSRLCELAYPDHFALKKGHKYFDAKSDPEKPRWFMVDVEFVGKFDDIVGLPALKADAALADMELIRYGRLSVQSVKKAEFTRVKKMAGYRG